MKGGMEYVIAFVHSFEAHNTRDRFSLAGPSRRSHGKRQPLKALAIFFLVSFPCCTQAVGWKWGTLGTSCTTTCASEGQTCVQGELEKVNNQANFDAVKVVDCFDYYSGSNDWRPGRQDSGSFSGGNDCFTQSGTGGTCTATYSDGYRVCPCTCPTNTFALPLQPWPCSR